MYIEIICLIIFSFLSPLLFIMSLIITIRYIKFETMIYMQVLILNIHVNVILIFYTDPDVKGIRLEALTRKSLN